MKLSIITINYNNHAGLCRTIDSVLRQSARQQIEYIVVDGDSTDGSAELLAGHDDKIDISISEPDSGIYNAMNKGVRRASGDYCLFLNSGDVLHDSMVLERILPKLEGTDFVIGKILFSNSGQLSDVAEPLTMRRFYNGSIPHPATFIKRGWLLKYPYDENLKIVSDWKFFIQALILDNAPYKLIGNIITDFDCEGISGTDKALVDKEREMVYRELFPERMLIDYLQFEKGSDYQQTPYDRFFIRLRDFNYAGIVYSASVFFVRIIAIFKKSARFVYNYPRRLKR